MLGVWEGGGGLRDCVGCVPIGATNVVVGCDTVMPCQVRIQLQHFVVWIDSFDMMRIRIS